MSANSFAYAVKNVRGRVKLSGTRLGRIPDLAVMSTKAETEWTLDSHGTHITIR